MKTTRTRPWKKNTMKWQKRHREDDYPDGGSCDLTQDQSPADTEGNFGFKVFSLSIYEEQEMETEIESTLSSDFASNKAIVLMKMEAAKRAIRAHAARHGLSDMTHQQKQQPIESNLQMAMRLPERKDSEEGSTVLVGIIRK